MLILLANIKYEIQGCDAWVVETSALSSTAWAFGLSCRYFIVSQSHA